MPFTLAPPNPPPPPPANVPLVDTTTGLAHQAWYSYFVSLARWQQALVAYLAAMAAEIP